MAGSGGRSTHRGRLGKRRTRFGLQEKASLPRLVLYVKASGTCRIPSKHHPVAEDGRPKWLIFHDCYNPEPRSNLWAMVDVPSVYQSKNISRVTHTSLHPLLIPKGKRSNHVPLSRPLPPLPPPIISRPRSSDPPNRWLDFTGRQTSSGRAGTHGGSPASTNAASRSFPFLAGV